jgi:predicted outer membrane repeat protein
MTDRFEGPRALAHTQQLEANESMKDTNRSPKSTLLPALIAGLTLTACTDTEPAESLESGEFRSLEDGLLLHWTFEDSVGTQITDVSGMGRHGTLQGAVLIASPNGQSVSLDGVDDWISLTGPRSPALYGGADGSFTLSARVRVTNASKYNTLCVGCGPFSSLYVGTEPYGPALLSALDDQTSTAWKWLTSSATLANDTWTEVTLVVENGSNARYYIDCELDAQLDSTNLGLIDVGSSSIGKSTVANRWFAGQIDELRVWDRALDDTELAELCPVVELDPLAEGLEMHWTFEDRTGNQILDVSGKGRTGTVVGGGSFVASPKGEALSLDGIDDKVTFIGPRALALYGGAQGDFTFSTRVRVPNVGKYNTLCSGCGPFSTMYVGDPAPGARVMSALWNLDTAATAWAASSSMLANDEWTEVTLVVEGGVAARTYQDCSLDSTLAGIDVGLRDPGFSVLGQGSVANRWYQGEVDELRVWNRALPDDEIALICARTELCDGEPVYVYVDAPAGGDGLSWATAFANLQDAIDASVACTSPQLWLAEGQYAPASSTLPVANIEHEVAIYGGFAGNEVLLSERDLAAHPVRLGAEGWLNRVVEIDDDVDDNPFTLVRLDGLTISGSAEGAIQVEGGGFGPDEVILENVTITDNVAISGGGLYTDTADVTVTIRNSSFERNHAGEEFLAHGGAIYARSTSLVIEDSSFVDNTAGQGGVIFFQDDPAEGHHITDTIFRGNAAAWGGALYIANSPSYIDVTIQGGEFDSNLAEGGGGAIYTEESSCSFDSVVFTNNTANVGGAIWLSDWLLVPNDKLEISNCRFIANRALKGNGGALRLQEVGTRVVNTEFIANQASTVGGAVFGRGEFTSSTFANNIAGSGSALYAPAGADMTMQHCVVYPDTIFGTNIHGPYSCTKSNTLLDVPKILLTNVTPFESADLDLDGLTEWYLDPDGPCVGLANGVIDDFEWMSSTVEQSQCTDAGWPEPGMHYPPQAAVGACE